MQTTNRPAASRHRSTSGGRKPCDLCGGQDFQLIGTLDRHGRPLETGVCQRCGLVAHMTVPGDAELAEYYARHYRRDYHGESAPSARRVMRAWKNGRRIHAKVGPHLRGDEKVFEVGAGIGCTVKAFEVQGHEASGIEPGENFQHFGRTKLGVDVEQGGLFDLPDRQRHDIVLLVHVIEHFNSPTRALRKIRSLLNPGGLLYLECPNLAAPFATRGRLFHFAHIYNFTPWTLLALAQKCGFALQERLSADDDPNLAVLLRRTEDTEWRVPEEGCRRTLERIGHYNLLTYHLRPGYLLPRLKKLASYVEEHLTAERFVKRLLAECRSPSQ